MYAGEVVEEAPTREIFSNPRHPYTQGLLRSLPVVGQEDRRYLYSIPGRVPDPRAVPPGSLFAPRCPYAIDRCWRERPRLEEEVPGHLLRCFNPQPFATLEEVGMARVDRDFAAE